ncbi:hypothetical protein N311_03879, partial [Apaloderma vittatum]
AALAGEAPPATVEAADAGELVGLSLRAQDAANGSRGGVAH